jgi:acetylglutamate kinase
LRDKNDPASLIPLIDFRDAAELLEQGVISGGMIPKVECCMDAIRRGVSKVFILDGRIPHSIIVEILSDEGAGTMVVERKP